MVEAIRYKQPSATKDIALTSVVAGVLNAGVQTGVESYRVHKFKKECAQLTDAFLDKAVKMEQAKNPKLCDKFFKLAENAENAIKNAKINWKNVGYSAAIGAALTAVFCTTLHCLNKCWNKD